MIVRRWLIDCQSLPTQVVAVVQRFSLFCRLSKHDSLPGFQQHLSLKTIPVAVTIFITRFHFDLNDMA
ncbi:hypothetical protein BT69DRAFT_1283340 [Atractiella rhizophila]|nr:hypothetical protein BT69DRAFT_1283340 [Atractiella rhizophila]